VELRLVRILAALAVAFFGIFVAIWFATSDGPASPPGPSAAAVPGATALATPSPAVDLARAPLGGIPGQQYVIVKDPPAPAPSPGSWEAVPIFASRRRPIALDLEELQPRLGECFSPSVSSRGGSVVETKDAAPLRDEAATTLLLQLEVTGDRVFIADAPVESRGLATNGTLSCAQAVLRGTTVPSPGLPDGKHRLRFALAP
jgi:hypothetical protein